jgi:hypothetical protein
MSATNKAWYWLAVGVLALGLNGYYQDGGLAVLHQAINRSAMRVAEARTQLRQVAAAAELTWGARAQCRRQTPAEVAVAPVAFPPAAEMQLALLQEQAGRLQAARVEARVARWQQRMARRDMQRAMVELQRGRLTVAGPQGQIEVTMPAMPDVEVNLPSVR